MSQRKLTFTEPQRVRLPDRFQDLPRRADVSNASSRAMNGVARPAGFSTHNAWKQGFARFKTGASTWNHGGGILRRKPLQMADCIMLGATAKRSGNNLKAARMMLAAGVLEDNRNHFKGAAKYYAKGAALFREMGDYDAEALCYNFASLSSFAAGDHTRSRSYCRKQRRVPMQNHAMAEEHVLVSLSNEGLSYRKSGDFLKAEKCHQRVANFSSSGGLNISSPSRMQVASLASGHLALSMLGQLDVSFQKGKKKARCKEAKSRGCNADILDRGIEALQRSHDLTVTMSQSDHASQLKEGQPQPHSNMLFDSSVNLGLLNLQRGDAKISESHFQRASRLAHETQDPDRISATNVHLGLAKGTLQMQAMMRNLHQRMADQTVSRNGAPKALQALILSVRYGDRSRDPDGDEYREKSPATWEMGDADVEYYDEQAIGGK